MATTVTREEALAHFGIKGMKWGVVREKVGSAVESHKRNRQLNKAHRKAENARDDAIIDAARQRFKSGEARRDYKAAKAQYKIDKKVIGTAAARSKFNEVKWKNRTDAEIANVAKSGREATLATLATVGMVGLTVALRVAASR